MCGICGIVDLAGGVPVAQVEAMCRAIAHRGPDGQDVYSEDVVALGHRRLAIIDLSDGGIQPFARADGALQLVHNGEIYNSVELRAELEQKGHRFRTATDTEVLLAAYEEWGTRCVERFNGMWAFAIWDARQRKLFCSRDRFGVKPLYYTWSNGRFAFASELKAFHAVQPLEPNRHLVFDYLTQGYIDHTNETLFEGIVTLPPAHSLVIDERGLRLERYWQLEPESAAPDPSRAFRELFLDSVRLRLRSDVAIGTALSGGLDSSAVACTTSLLLRTHRDETAAVGTRQRTFTAYFEDSGFDERPYAKQVVDEVDADAHWISFTDRDLVDALPSIVYSQDEPFGSTSIVAQWFVMREAARAGIRVMLDGQGGDEVLAGYPAYRGARLADLLATAQFARLSRELSAGNGSLAGELVAIGRPFLPERLKWKLRARATGGSELVGSALRGFDRPPHLSNGPFRSRLRKTMYRILTQQGLPELLHYEDRNSMAHSIEARVPFLDYRLVELLFSLPPETLFDEGVTKVVMRNALSDVLPSEIRDRRDKLGFVTPGGRFFRGALGALAEDAFASRSFQERGFVDGSAARRVLARHRAGEQEAGQELWRALNLELWARAFLDVRPKIVA
jgi:asparagine synthase (glutamine-hydrolysing)